MGLQTPLPKFSNSLADFVGDLRTLVFRHQTKIASHIYIDRSTISKYENGVISPPVGYLCYLAESISGRLYDSAQGDEHRVHLLREVNKAIRRCYSGEAPFQDWRELSFVAASYFEERQKNSEDVTGGARTVSENKQQVITSLHQLPPPPKDFTGRTKELVELMEAIQESGIAISGLRGMGGVGKTALALKVAQRIAPWYPDAQLYIDLKGTSRQPLLFTDVMGHVIRAFDLTTELPSDEVELSGLYHTKLRGLRAILLMDNAADAEQIKPLVPPTSCILIVTTRQHFMLPGLYPLHLNTLSPAEAKDLLLMIAPRINEYADEIAQLCGYLPLALRLAGSAVAERKELTLQDFVRRLSDNRKRLKFLDSNRELSGEPLGVEASLNLSYELLSSEMQEQLLVLSLFPGSFDSLSVAYLWDQEHDITQDNLSTLVRFSLVEWEPKAKRYRLHDLVKLFIDTRLNAEERVHAQARHAEYYLDIIRNAADKFEQGGNTIYQGVKLFDLEWENILAGIQWAEEFSDKNEEAGKLCNNYPKLGWSLLHLRQHPEDQIRLSKSALLAARRLKDPLSEAIHLEHLGRAHDDFGECGKAIGFYEQALEIFRRLKEPNREAAVLNGLGSANKSLGMVHQAIELYQLALNIFQELGDRRAEGSVIGNLGLAYSNLGELRRAIVFYEKQLVITREIGDRLGEGNALSNMGLAYINLGERRHAIDILEEALVIRREFGDKRREAQTLNNIGLAYLDLGDYQHAIGIFEEILPITQEVGDRENESNVIGNLANIYFFGGQYRRAIDYYNKQLELTREIEYRRGEANALSNMGEAHAALGETSRAVELYKKALAIRREIGDSRGEADTLNALGHAYIAVGEYRRALESGKTALANARKAGDRYHEAHALICMGGASSNLGKFQEATNLYNQALAMVSDIGDRYGESQVALGLGNMHFRQGNLQQALDCFEQYRGICRDIGNRIKEGNAAWNIAQTQSQLGDFARALAYAEYAKQIFEQFEADVLVQKIQNQLSNWQEQKEEKEE